MMKQITYTSYFDIKKEVWAVCNEGVPEFDALCMVAAKYYLSHTDLENIMSCNLPALDSVIEKIDGGMERIEALDKTIEDFELDDNQAALLVKEVNRFDTPLPEIPETTATL